jgi:2-iminobutanoate/2-iminopropanoate deaminase
MRKTAIVTDKAPKALGPYSAGVASNGSINVSGQLGIDPATGKLAGDDIQSQTRQSLTNVKNILEACWRLHGRRGRDHRPSR